MNNIICRAYFSPHGTTKKIIDAVAGNFQGIRLICDFMKQPSHGEVSLTNKDLLIIGLPVFSGRIPDVCRTQIAAMHGDATPAIIAITYGNRAYEDALLELKILLTAHGFRVISAAAFICEHSIFPKIAQGRPNDEDMTKVKEFAHISLYIWNHLSANYTATLEVPGNKPYRKVKKHPLRLEVKETCTNCGICVSVCPVHAISARHPQKTSRRKCIACTACIYACPAHARRFQGTIYEKAKSELESSCTKEKKPEIFI